MAVILAHEISHVVARHSGENVSHALVGMALKLAITVGLGGGAAATDMLVDATVGLPFSRRAECEADKMGLELLTRACYRPEAAPKVFARLRQAQGPQGTPAFLSTHPSSEERVRAMQAELPAARRLYDAEGCPPSHQHAH